MVPKTCALADDGLPVTFAVAGKTLSGRQQEDGMGKIVKAVAAVALLFAVGIGGASPLEAQGTCKPVKEYRGGALYECGGLRMAVLQGSYRQMGRQYGGLLKEDILAYYDRMIDKFVLKTGLFTEEDLAGLIVRPAIRTQAKRQNELLRGMAEETGLSFEKHVLLSLNIEALMYLRKIGSGNATACTSLAAWGDYTIDRRTYTARNFDFPNIYRELSRTFGIVLVLKPTDGSNAIAGLCHTGMITFFDGMNDKGLYIEGNNAADSEGLILYTDRSAIFNEAINMLMDADDIDAFEGRLRTTRANYPLIFMAAGPREACFFENGTTGTQKRSAREDGLISAANQFLEPAWHIAPLKNPGAWFSPARQGRLEALAKANKGKIDEKVMMAILDQRLFNQDGSPGKGASVIEKLPHEDEVTATQVVTDPSQKKMWVRIPTYTDWILFDLGKVFGN